MCPLSTLLTDLSFSTDWHCATCSLKSFVAAMPLHSKQNVPMMTAIKVTIKAIMIMTTM